MIVSALLSSLLSIGYNLSKKEIRLLLPLRTILYQKPITGRTINRDCIAYAGRHRMGPRAVPAVSTVVGMCAWTMHLAGNVHTPVTFTGYLHINIVDPKASDLSDFARHLCCRDIDDFW